MASTVTSKGQVTVPKKIRDYLGLQPGSAVAFSLGPDGQVVVQAQAAKPLRHKGRLRRMRGTLATGRSTDELMCMLRGYDDDVRDPGLK
jgi:antitoxin PrlF